MTAWRPAFPPASARRLVLLPEPLVHFFAPMSGRRSTVSPPRQLPLRVSTLATARRDAFLSHPPLPQVPAPGNPRLAPLLAPRPAKARPPAPCAPEPPPPPYNVFFPLSDSLQLPF